MTDILLSADAEDADSPHYLRALTDMAEKMTRGVPQADGQLKIEPVMPAAEVARAVWHMATLPKGTNVQFMTVMATKMPFIGRG
mgnify:CR=1 FL=1